MKYLLLSVSIFVLLLFPLFDLLHPGLPITHDGQDHVARIANFYQNLTEGNVVPRWAANLNWGYGHPILMFLYPLPSYLASFFHFLGFSFIDSLKIVFGVAYIASAFSMYLWIKEFFGEEEGFVAGILYIFAPYRFVDLYVRGAIGEHVAFVFPPLICYFLLKISKKYSYWYIVGGSASLAGLILSHNAITLMFLPLIFLYIIYLFWFSANNKKFIYSALYIVLLGFGLSAFFLFPAFFEGKYTLRDIVTKNEYAKSFVNWKDFIYGSWSYGGTGQFTVQVGIVQWSLTVIALLVGIILRKKKSLLVIVLATFIIFWATLFIMGGESGFIWKKVTLLQKFQFPWRFLSVLVFITSLFGGLFVLVVPKRLKLAIVVLIVALVLLFNKDYWHARGFLYKDDQVFKNIYFGTTDTGESAPIWSVRFMEKLPKSKTEVIGGIAKVAEHKRTSTKHTYEIEVLTDRAQIRENTLYFPGWEVKVDDQQTQIEYQSEVNRGVITFFLDKGKHNVMLVFGETKLRLLADIISILSLVILFFSGILRQRRIWRHFR